MPSLLFVLANLLAVAASLCAAALLFQKREPYRRFLAAMAGFPILVYAVQMVLGNLGLLGIGPAILLLLAVAGPLAVLAWRRSAKDEGSRADEPTKRSEEEVAYWWLGFGLLCGVGALAFASTCLQGTSFCGDDLVYHATAPAKWYQEQKLSLAPHYYNGYYAMNAELFSLWFILPFGRDGMVWMAGAYWTFLFAAATFVLVRVQGQRAHVAAMCTALVLAAPPVLGMACTFTACDLAAAALVLAATAMAMPSRNLASGGDRVVDAAYAGLLSGLALGIKITMAPPALILLAVVAVLPRRTISVRQRILAVTVFAASLVFTGGYWYVRNLILTGNPLFPATVAIFSGPFDAATQRPTKLIYWLFGAGSNMKQRLALAVDFTTWPLGLFLVSAGGGLLALVRLLRRKALDDPQRPYIAVLSLMAVIVLVLHPFIPYSGMTNSPVGAEPPRIELRYLLIPFAIGIILAGPLLDAKNRRRPLCWALGALAMVTAFGYSESLRPSLIRHYGAVSFALGAAALVSLNPVAWIWSRIRYRKTAAFIAIAVLLVAEVLMLPYHQRLTDGRIFDYLSPDGGANPTWTALEKLPPGSHIVPILHRFYPLYGRHFQFQVQPVLADGSPFRPLHQRWKTGLGWWPLVGFSDPLDPAPFVGNLLKTDAQYVVVARQPVIRYPLEQWPWPPQYKLLRESPDARLITENEFSALFQLKRNGR